ncbi:MAG: DUF2326 domain-containing protein [Bacteroidaceae bacterium]|nr:DUF2326 domain-containing protein [Bacteroidaceae bacterium]
MFIKLLTIYNKDGIIREIPFHKGLNLIVDNTPNITTTTGNNVGKTTVLKLIDFCLGKDGRIVYSDPASPKVEHTYVKDFLIDTDVVVELILTSDFEKNDVIIRRNFKKRGNSLREINGVNYTNDELFIKELEQIILGIQIEKPSFRQIISHNIRYSEQNVSNVLKTLDPYSSDAEYETLFLFMFGCRFAEGDMRQEKLEKIKTDRNFKTKLERTHGKSTYLSLLGLVNARIAELQIQKASLNINPNFAEDMDNLNEVKYQINSISSKINSLRIRRDMIIDAQKELEAQKSSIDIVQLELIYKQAKALIPDIQRTFEELVAYHNQMLDNKVRFILKSLPGIDEQLAELQQHLRVLLVKEDVLTQKVVKSSTYDDLEKLINELNSKYQEKGEYENIIYQIEAVEEEISASERELQAIDENLFSDTFKNHLQEQIDKFNVLFSQVSRAIYNEEYVIKFDSVINRRTKTNIYKFTSFNANLSTGKKMGEISCFDIAYTMFARQENIPCLYFTLNDKKELMSDNQLVSIANMVQEQNIQFVASILRDKLPAELNTPELFIVELSQDDKLFKLPD